AEVILQTLRQIEPAEVRQVVERAGLEAGAARTALERLLQAGDLVALSPVANGLTPSLNLMSLAGWEKLAQRARQTVAAYHRQYPFRSGMPREELKSRLKLPGRLFNEVLARLVGTGEIVEQGASVRLP